MGLKKNVNWPIPNINTNMIKIKIYTFPQCFSGICAGKSNSIHYFGHYINYVLKLVAFVKHFYVII